MTITITRRDCGSFFLGDMVRTRIMNTMATCMVVRDSFVRPSTGIEYVIVEATINSIKDQYCISTKDVELIL